MHKEEGDSSEEYTKQVEAQEETKELAQNKLLLEAIETLRDHGDPCRFASYKRPIKRLVSTLGEKDCLRIAGGKMDMPAGDAKKCAPLRAPRSESQITYADGVYIATAADTTKVKSSLNSNSTV